MMNYQLTVTYHPIFYYEFEKYFIPIGQSVLSNHNNHLKLKHLLVQFQIQFCLVKSTGKQTLWKHSLLIF